MKTLLKRYAKKIKKAWTGQGKINLKGQGIVNLIDVGSVGKLPSPWEENSKYIKNLLKFEPRDPNEEHPNIISVDTALWSENCKKEFYIYKGSGGTGSSLFKQNYEYVKQNFEHLCNQGDEKLAKSWFERSQLEKVKTIEVRTLDSVLDEIAPSFPYHFLKIDAQGAEYQILKGAEQFLKRDCLGLQLELFVIPLYKDIKLLPEVEKYLNQLGFEMVKKFPPHGSFDSQHDCVFLKKELSGSIIECIRKIYQL